MTAPRTPTRLLVGALGVLAMLATACSSDSDKSTTTTQPAAATTAPAAETTAAGGGESTVPASEAPNAYEGLLVGTFAITAGDCTTGTPAGSWFQMLGSDGKAVPNGDSMCADSNYSLLTPGKDGGLLTSSMQVAPDPAFDAAGNGLPDGIFVPVKFFGFNFAGAMDNSKQPSIVATSGALSGDLSAFTAYYANGNFNQGAPKPDGSGSAPTGTIDPATGAFVIEWTSLISGGSFDGFTGVWHLEGTYTAA